MTDPLLKYVLGQVEKSPQATFTEAELRRVSSGEFEGLVKARLLKYKRSDPDQETFPCPTPCDKGCDRAIGKIGGVYQAICQGHSDVKPIHLSEGDLKMYAFDIDKLLAMIGKKNQLAGSSPPIDGRIFFAGERIIGQKRTGVFLAFLRNQREADSALLGLSNQIPTYERTLVLLPLCDKTSQSLLKKLENQNIVVTRFEEAFPRSDLAIDFAGLERKRPKAGLEYPPPSEKHQRDKDVYGYKCDDWLRFTGEKPKRRSSPIWLNDIQIRVPNNEMLLLLYLARELRKGEGGWVHKDRFYEEGITEEDIPQRLIGRLRDTLALGLLDRDGEKFIEKDDEGSYRISTHPDFVKAPGKNWLIQKYNEVREAIRVERKKRENQKQKRDEAEVRRARLKQN